jgi:glyoxylase-like metal-dependent hydrolase (beta-lactamase superfamily II)
MARFVVDTGPADVGTAPVAAAEAALDPIDILLLSAARSDHTLLADLAEADGAAVATIDPSATANGPPIRDRGCRLLEDCEPVGL